MMLKALPQTPQLPSRMLNIVRIRNTKPPHYATKKKHPACVTETGMVYKR